MVFVAVAVAVVVVVVVSSSSSSYVFVSSFPASEADSGFGSHADLQPFLGDQAHLKLVPRACAESRPTLPAS
jgi:hypothetical protein